MVTRKRPNRVSTRRKSLRGTEAASTADEVAPTAADKAVAPAVTRRSTRSNPKKAPTKRSTKKAVEPARASSRRRSKRDKQATDAATEDDTSKQQSDSEDQEDDETKDTGSKGSNHDDNSEDEPSEGFNEDDGDDADSKKVEDSKTVEDAKKVEDSKKDAESEAAEGPDDEEDPDGPKPNKRTRRGTRVASVGSSKAKGAKKSDEKDAANSSGPDDDTKPKPRTRRKPAAKESEDSSGSGSDGNDPESSKGKAKSPTRRTRRRARNDGDSDSNKADDTEKDDEKDATDPSGGSNDDEKGTSSKTQDADITRRGQGKTGLKEDDTASKNGPKGKGVDSANEKNEQTGTDVEEPKTRRGRRKAHQIGETKSNDVGKKDSSDLNHQDGGDDEMSKTEEAEKGVEKSENESENGTQASEEAARKSKLPQEESREGAVKADESEEKESKQVGEHGSEAKAGKDVENEKAKPSEKDDKGERPVSARTAVVVAKKKGDSDRKESKSTDAQTKAGLDSNLARVEAEDLVEPNAAKLPRAKQDAGGETQDAGGETKMSSSTAQDARGDKGATDLKVETGSTADEKVETDRAEKSKLDEISTEDDGKKALVVPAETGETPEDQQGTTKVVETHSSEPPGAQSKAEQARKSPVPANGASPQTAEAIDEEKSQEAPSVRVRPADTLGVEESAASEARAKRQKLGTDAIEPKSEIVESSTKATVDEEDTHVRLAPPENPSQTTLSPPVVDQQRSERVPFETKGGDQTSLERGAALPSSESKEVTATPEASGIVEVEAEHVSKDSIDATGAVEEEVRVKFASGVPPKVAPSLKVGNQHVSPQNSERYEKQDSVLPTEGPQPSLSTTSGPIVELQNELPIKGTGEDPPGSATVTRGLITTPPAKIIDTTAADAPVVSESVAPAISNIDVAMEARKESPLGASKRQASGSVRPNADEANELAELVETRKEGPLMGSERQVSGFVRPKADEANEPAGLVLGPEQEGASASAPVAETKQISGSDGKTKEPICVPRSAPLDQPVNGDFSSHQDDGEPREEVRQPKGAPTESNRLDKSVSERKRPRENVDAPGTTERSNETDDSQCHKKQRSSSPDDITVPMEEAGEAQGSRVADLQDNSIDDDDTVSSVVTEKSTISQKPRVSLDRIKVLLFSEGSLVHRERGYQRTFAQYWDALSLRLEGQLSVDNANKCRTVLASFLKTRKLRKLHNKLIMGLLERCVQPTSRLADVSQNVPDSWQKRVKVLSKPQSCVEPTAKGNRSRRDPALFPDYTPVISESPLDPPTERAYSVNTALRIPGAIAIDPNVRARANQIGMKVSENAVWLLVVAAKEYANSLLKSSIASVKAIEAGHVPPRRAKHQVTRKTRKSPSKDNATATVEPTPRQPVGGPRCITAPEVHAFAASLPSGAVLSLGGSVSRLSFERSLFSSLDMSVVTGGSAYDTVRQYLTTELLSSVVSAKTKKAEPASQSAGALSKRASSASPFEIPTKEKKKGPVRPPVGGLGRGAKNLAALKARASVATKESGGGANSSPTPGAGSVKGSSALQAQEPGASVTKTTESRPPDTNDASNGPTADSKTKDSATQQEAEPATGVRKGKGFGVKNLRAMMARGTPGKVDEEEPAPGNGNEGAASASDGRAEGNGDDEEQSKPQAHFEPQKKKS